MVYKGILGRDYRIVPGNYRETRRVQYPGKGPVRGVDTKFLSLFTVNYSPIHVSSIQMSGESLLYFILCIYRKQTINGT